MGLKDVSFQDETFFTHALRVNMLADEFLKRNLSITWTATLRADQACRLGENLFAKAVRSGLRRVMVGVESGSQEMLDRLQKDMKLEQVRVAADMCTRHGVGAIFNFIVGFPGESDESMQANARAREAAEAMESGVRDADLLLPPVPRQSARRVVRRARLRLPEGLEEWATSITSAGAVRGSPPINGRRWSGSSFTPGMRGSPGRGGGRSEPHHSGDASTTGTACPLKS
jgi:hypothetical protein